MRFVLSALLAIWMCGASAAQQAPARIMSLNLCTDQLLLMLAPRERITSVTWLARDASGSVMADAARATPINHAQAEEVLAQRPDLVLAGQYTAPTTRALIERVGFRVLAIPEANSFADIRAVTRLVGDAIGARARAEALIDEMDERLRDLAQNSPSWRARAAAWDGGGVSPGRGTLFDAILGVAGARNLAAEQGLDGFGAFDLETLIRTQPDVLIEGAPGFESPSLKTEAALHSYVRTHYANWRIFVPQALYACGTPRSVEAAILIRERLTALAP